MTTTQLPKLVRLTDKFEDGKLMRIECHVISTGEHAIDVLWDERDERTPEEITKFRLWAVGAIKRAGFDPLSA